MAPNNPLQCWGNEKTMNMNHLILTNIQSSPYFKVNLYELKTYHEVIDEIYYKVEHLEPWERGSRKTAGQTGMCGGVRGVGAGGIVSSAYCLLYKLFTLKLTKKQVVGLLTHKDSPYIRGIGFMYIRYSQDPKELWDWFEPYLDDEEEIDVKAGGGHTIRIGDMARQMLVKLEWYSTLFPRIPVPVQKMITANLTQRPEQYQEEPEGAQHIPDEEVNFGEAEKYNNQRRDRSPQRGGKRSPPRRSPPKRRSPERRSPPKRRSPERRRSPDIRRSPDRRRHSPDRRRSPGKRRSPDRPRFSDRRRSPERRRSRDRRRSPPRHRSSHHSSSHSDDFSRDLQRERERQIREKDKGSDSRSGSKDRERRHRSRSRDKKRRRSRSHERGSAKRSHKDKRSRSRSRKDRQSHSNSPVRTKSKKSHSLSASPDTSPYENRNGGV